MNNTIDDFFNEISDLEQSKQPKHKQTVWQECYDELTGYSYYWNTKTDEVTWTTPPDFKLSKEQKKARTSPRKKELYVPPRAAPVLPSTSTKVAESSIKIYSIGDNSKKKSDPITNKIKTVEKKEPAKKPFRKDSDSEDEKIELISSYGGETESETEEFDLPTQNDIGEKTKGNDSNLSDDDDVDILTKIQKRAKELKEMGGDLPPELASVVNTEKTIDKPSPEGEKNATGLLSLVAGYSDSEEEQESEEVKSIFPIPPEPPKVAHSTLFPITKPIDVKDFLQPAEKKVETPNEFDTKAFQRKRRIGVALMNTGKKKGEEPEELETEARGLGFKSENTTVANTKETTYAGFRKGGVMFVKSDVLNPSMPKTEENNSENIENKTEELSGVKQTELEEIYATLMEKLGFLSEGRPQVSPVQAMSIQAETLFTAMKESGLKPTYLQRWLNNTHADLLKLEKDAAPEGWLLQWDRSHKRYYYQNQTTGESQWEYPQPDISRCDEAMDISTTPPPAEPTIHLSPPLPPVIRSPTPPPPPIISKEEEDKTKNHLPDVPLPAEPVVSAKFLNDGEPLPPGVDLPEIIAYTKPKEKETKVADPLFSALDSFYSDIASMENPNPSSSPPLLPSTEENKTQSESSVEPPKKKKKTKVKLAPGLAMKKKGVSQLVEKWKSVQQHYND